MQFILSGKHFLMIFSSGRVQFNARIDIKTTIIAYIPRAIKFVCTKNAFAKKKKSWSSVRARTSATIFVFTAFLIWHLQSRSFFSLQVRGRAYVAQLNHFVAKQTMEVARMKKINGIFFFIYILFSCFSFFRFVTVFLAVIVYNKSMSASDSNIERCPIQRSEDHGRLHVLRRSQCVPRAIAAHFKNGWNA